MRKVYNRKFTWGRLFVRADWAQAASPIYFSTEYQAEDPVWAPTPYQVASFSHNSSKALTGVNKWLKAQ